jgi:hypothetical protein
LKKKGQCLYQVNTDVICVKCGHRGAVKYYGKWYSSGLGDVNTKSLEKYRSQPYMSHAVGFSGTIPWQCTNCGNQGLIDFGGLEGYAKAFETRITEFD